MSTKIESMIAREIFDSRGNPTVEVRVRLENGVRGRASVPSGASKGSHEALELRDKDDKRFYGQGVLKACDNVNTVIQKALKGMDALNQAEVDRKMIELDGTENKSKLGANAILAVSLGVLRAATKTLELPLYKYIRQISSLSSSKDYPMPAPIMNIFNGGKHADTNLDFQEFHLIPSTRFPYHQALQLGTAVYKNLKTVLKDRQAVHSVGDEGGYAPNLFTNLDALSAILDAVKLAHLKFTRDVFLGLDVAAHFFFKNGRYQIKDRAQPFSRDELIAYYQELNREFHLFSLEDPLDQDDWQGWSKLTEEIGSTTLVVGDDLLATNKDRVKKASQVKACNAILVKPNQIGTVSETVEVVKYCRERGWKIIVSHRSGETNDTFIADLAVGLGADFTKFGAPARGERIAKYNRLLAIEEEIKANESA